MTAPPCAASTSRRRTAPFTRPQARWIWPRRSGPSRSRARTRSSPSRRASARCSAASCGSAAEPREHRDEPVGDPRDLARGAGRRVAAERGDLDRRDGLDRLGARDGEGARLVRARDATSALGAVEARGLGGADRLVTKLRVADRAAEHGEQELPRDAVRDELVVRKNGISVVVGLVVNSGINVVVVHGVAPFTHREGATPWTTTDPDPAAPRSLAARSHAAASAVTPQAARACT